MKKLLGLLLLCSQFALAQDQTLVVELDSKGGGGGDPLEMRVDEIRSDLLQWIKDGGSEGLELPAGITLEEYNKKMKKLLKPKFTRVILVQKGTNAKPELTVDIDGSPKTCRSFFSLKDKKPTIICVISRLRETSKAQQYPFIHHEYASLGMLERNDGIESDYIISNQLTYFLKDTVVSKLSIERSPETYKHCQGPGRRWSELCNKSAGTTETLNIQSIKNMDFKGRCYDRKEPMTPLPTVLSIRSFTPDIVDDGPMFEEQEIIKFTFLSSSNESSLKTDLMPYNKIQKFWRENSKILDKGRKTWRTGRPSGYSTRQNSKYSNSYTSRSIWKVGDIYIGSIYFSKVAKDGHRKGETTLQCYFWEVR